MAVFYTGYGGGYMEREEVVEYKETRDVSDDDEFDEVNIYSNEHIYIQQNG